MKSISKKNLGEDWTEDVSITKSFKQTAEYKNFIDWLHSQNLYFQVITSILFKEKVILKRKLYSFYVKQRVNRDVILPDDKQFRILNDIIRITSYYPVRNLTTQEKKMKAKKELGTNTNIMASEPLPDTPADIENSKLIVELEFKIKNKQIPEDISINEETNNLLKLIEED